MASAFVDALGSPTAVAALGVTTLVLLGTTVYLSGGSSGDGGDGAAGRRKARAADDDAEEADATDERPALDRTVSVFEPHPPRFPPRFSRRAARRPIFLMRRSSSFCDSHAPRPPRAPRRSVFEKRARVRRRSPLLRRNTRGVT